MKRIWLGLLLLFAGVALFLGFKGAVTAGSSITRTYYIAADTIDWNYVPADSDLTFGKPLRKEGFAIDNAPPVMATTFRKAVYREYTDSSFTTRKPRPPKWQQLGILGPVLRGAVGDTIVVVFRNNTSFPASMHPHGVFYDEADEEALYNDGTSGPDKLDDSVPPGGTHRYVWPIPERAGDPWSWYVYSAETGEHAGSYLVRSGGHKWADLDAYDAGFGPKGSARFNADVGPLLASWTSYIQQDDTTERHLPDSANGYNMVTLITYHLKPDKWRTFEASVKAVDQVIAKHDYPVRYAWYSIANGGRGPVRGLAIFHQDWASFKEPDPNLVQTITQEYGSDLAEHILQDFSGSYYGVESEVLRFRPELSVQHSGQ